jgi:hypothetical protein
MAPRPQPDDPQGRKWYRHRKWKRIRRRQLDREPFCAVCWEQLHVVVLAVIVDHIIPHEGDWTRFITGKLRSLCFQHHEERHGRRPQWTDLDGSLLPPGSPPPECARNQGHEKI